jgi:ribosomal protein L11 methyltransferase
VGQAWLGQWAEELQKRFPQSVALIQCPGTCRAIVEISCAKVSEARTLFREFGGGLEKLRPDWLEQLAKRNRTKPLWIGSRLIVSRTRTRTAKGTRAIVIPAEAAFGTGEHATTAMCLRLLEQITRKRDTGWSMLDAGTGSGILAIAGSYFGAGCVLAIDNDPLACAAAKRNARLNGVRNIEFLTADILKEKLAGKFEVITANLFSEIVMAALPIWSRHLARSGALILSGILRSQEPAVVRALRRHGFTVSEIRRRGKWIALLCS